MKNSSSAPPADETRSRLLEAANVIFSELGFQGATTRMICERAQANRAAVNYHFGDKLGLYAEVLKLNFGGDSPRVESQQLLEMEPEAALGKFVSLFFHDRMRLDEGQPRMKLLGHELSQPTPALASMVEQIMRPPTNLLCEIISRITGCPPDALGARLAAQSIIAQVTQYVNARPIIHLMWANAPGGPGSNEEIVAHITEFSLCGLAALRAPSKATKAAATDKKAGAADQKAARRRGA